MWNLGIIEQDTSRITSAEVKFRGRSASTHGKITKTNEDILSGFKINPVVKTLKNCGNKWLQHVQRMDRNRLLHWVMKCQPCRNGAKDDPYKDFLTTIGTGTGHKVWNLASYVVVLMVVVMMMIMMMMMMMKWKEVFSLKNVFIWDVCIFCDEVKNVFPTSWLIYKYT